MDNNLLIINPPPTETQNLRFRVGTTTHDRHFPIITDPDISFNDLMYHIETFKTTLSSAVTANQLAAACFQLFPRTLVNPNYAHVWPTLLVANEQTTVAHFDATLLRLIAEFFTSADRVRFANELRRCRLPRDMRVPAFARSLERNNNRIVSMPGTEPELTPDQIKEAFYQAMPVAWKANWNNHHPGTLHETNFTDIVSYFAHQQLNSIEKVKQNLEKQRLDKQKSLSGKKRTERSERTNKHIKGADRANRDHRNNQESTVVKGFVFGHFQDPDTPCLIHPGKGHNWKICNKNPANMKAPPSKQPDKDNTKIPKKNSGKKARFSTNVGEEATTETANVATGDLSIADMPGNSWGSAFVTQNNILNDDTSINLDGIELGEMDLDLPDPATDNDGQSDGQIDEE